MGSIEESGDPNFVACVTIIFVIVALQLLFPSNVFVPLDRRASTMLGAIWVMIVFYLFPAQSKVNVGSFVDFDVLIVLTAIMIINFILLRQPFLARVEHKMQDLIRSDRNMGFFVVSLVSLFVSPVIMNDGLCLMLVHPVLDAFPSINNNSTKKQLQLQSQLIDHSAEEEVKSGDIHEFTVVDVNEEDQEDDDALFYMLNIACSANIGSALTFSGNPQNLLVAQHLSKLLSGGAFFALMLLPVFASWVITLGYLQLCRIAKHRGVSTYALFTTFFHSKSKTMKGIPSGKRRLMHHVDDTDSDHPDIHSAIHTGIDTDIQAAKLTSPKKIQKETQLEDTEHRAGAKAVISPVSSTFTIVALLMIIALEFQGTLSLTGVFSGISLSLLIALYLAKYYPLFFDTLFMAWKEGQIVHVLFPSSTVSQNPTANSADNDKKPYQSLRNDKRNDVKEDDNTDDIESYNDDAPVTSVKVTSSKSTAGVSHTALSMPLRRMLKKLACVRHEIGDSLEALVHELDFNLLLIFTGLFIVSGAFVMTGIPRQIWDGLAASGGEGGGAFQSLGSISVLSFYIVTASQLVGNVPVVYMARNQIAQLDTKPQILGWLLLAFVSTLAGNLTLVGSAANIIVAEKSRRHASHPVELNAPYHLYHCCVVTAISIVVGIILIVVEVQLFL